MAFNVDKCHQLTISRKNKPRNTSYSLHGQTLEKVKSVKYLGVEISEDLSWGKHIQSITAKANRTSAFVHRNLRGCPVTTQTNVYKAMIRPLVEYAAPVWDPYHQNHIQKVERIQRQSARRIFQDFSYTTSASTLVSKLKLPTLEQRRNTAKATMIYKIMNGLVDITPVQGTLTPANRSTRRHTSKLMVPHCRTDVYLHSFFPSAIRIWNNLPSEAPLAGSPKAFKSVIGRL